MTKRAIYKILPALFVLLIYTEVQAQRPNQRNQKKETEQPEHEIDPASEYAAAVQKSHELTARLDTLNNEAAEMRRLLIADPGNKQQYESKIIELEQLILDTREELKGVNERIELIERKSPEIAMDYALTLADTPQQPRNQYADLVNNDALRARLPQADYDNLRKAQETERSVYEDLGRVRKNYDQMAEVYKVYMNATSQIDADSLYIRITTCEAENKSILSEIEAMWEYVFEIKLYSYNYLFDKDNASEVLAQMQENLNDANQKELAAEGQYMYDVAAVYPIHKELILKYESAVAEHYGLNLAADSIARVRKNLRADTYRMPKIDLTERLFLDFENVEIAKTVRYTAANPIPECTIYRKGIIYRILIDSYPRKQAVSVFRNIAPLYWEQKKDNHYYYYAGGFATLEEAESALQTVRKAGLAKASIVVWQNGEYISDNVSSVKSGTKQAGTETAGIQYRIEITIKGALTPSLRTIINDRAANKELTRSPGKQEGEAIFILGLFDSKVLAESIAKDMADAEPSADIKVSELK